MRISVSTEMVKEIIDVSWLHTAFEKIIGYPFNKKYSLLSYLE